MYDFFVTGGCGAWNNGFYVYERSRFLEYTNDKTAEAFAILTDNYTLDRLVRMQHCLSIFFKFPRTVVASFDEDIPYKGTAMLLPLHRLTRKFPESAKF